MAYKLFSLTKQNNNNNSLFSPFIVQRYINIVISKKDGGDWLPEITKVNRKTAISLQIVSENFDTALENFDTALENFDTAFENVDTASENFDSK